MKQYKGWEIAKMICEGTLKHGNIVKSNGNDYQIVDHHLETIFGSEELGCSMFSSKSRLYEIVQQPVSFMEAINSCKKFKVEHYLVRNIPEFNNYMHFNVMCRLLYLLVNNDVKKIMTESKCYIEESEE